MDPYAMWLSGKHRLVSTVVLVMVVPGGTVVWRVCHSNATEARINRLLRGPSTGPYGNYLLDSETRQEIRNIGTNAIPHLLRALDRNCQDSGLDRFLRRVRVSGRVKQHHPLPRWELRHHIADAFAALGPASASAVPELAKRLREPETAQLAADSVAAIGDLGAKRAVPELLAAFRSTNAMISNAGASALLMVDPEAAREAGIR